MKATELRVNNWYNSTKFQIPVICEFADFAELDARADGAKVDEDLVDEMFQPILLTEEWLLKFGFELKDEVNMGFIKQINFPHMKNYLYANSKFYTTALWDDKKQIEIFIMNQAKYVHQLQNLYFALTGNELEIK